MKKSLVALATLAAATGAMAQVTITGFFNGSVDSFSVGNAAATRTGNKSETRFTDNSSRIIFGVREDLGGGMAALGQLDFRFSVDAAQRAQPGDGSLLANSQATSGNNHVGLSSKDWGSVRMGRQDVQYVEGAHYNPVGTATILSHITLLHSNGANGSIANWSRTPNLLWWTSNPMNGITATVGYSTNPLRASGGYMEQENEMASNIRRGNGTYLKLNGKFLANKLDATISVTDFKGDFRTAAFGQTTSGTCTGTCATNSLALTDNADQKGTFIGAKYDLGGGWGVGLAQTKNESTNDAKVKREVTATQLGLGYKTGANTFAVTMTKKGNNKSGGVETANSGADATGIVWGYDLSKNTQLTAGYTQIKNKSAGGISMFYNAENAVGTYGSGAAAGETHKATSVGLRVAF